ncbi:MAG: GntR family transcriptional regulator [Desulfobacterales bacterium]|nr:GntR family transcriptional regulator [Desulfobacterales bacterium]
MSYVQQAYRTIKRRILENHYPPGQQVLEQELADDLGMSRTPVREALIRLHEEGLVELIPRRGMRVVPLAPGDMQEIYEVLTALEVAAVELAARRHLNHEALQPLEEALQAMETRLAADDLDGWARADARFHQALIALSGNKRLVGMAATLADQVHRARMITLRLRPRPNQSIREHQEVLEALRSGEGDRAGRAHRRHRRNAARLLLDLLKYYRLPHL